MDPKLLLITVPDPDLNALNGACEHVLGRSLLRATSGATHELSATEKLLACLSAFRTSKPPRLSHLLAHLSFSLLVVADDRDLYAILEHCAGMAFVTTETLARGVLASVLSGTLAQWREAVIAGCQTSAEPAVRMAFNAARNIFLGVGLNVWTDYRVREAPDKTLLLEYKPR